jgi:hypothetical protein
MPQPAHNSVQQPAQSSAPCRRRISPAVALAVLSPVIAEVLSGATHLSVIFVIIPEILVWGGGALLIREVARRRKLSGTALLLMGFVLSLAEEIFIQQTSLAPLPWIKTAIYGRTAGVNWIYLLFQLGYESVWVVVVPVQLVELMYPERRSEHWLRTRGLIITSILFLLGARIAWYAWIKRVRPMIFHLSPYHPSPYAFLTGLVAAAVLIAIAVNLRAGLQAADRWVPASEALFFFVLVFGLAWYMLLVLQFSNIHALTSMPFWIPMIVGIAWGAMVFALMRHWSQSSVWTDMHRYAAVFATMLVCMTGGWLGASLWLRIDQIAQVVFDVAAIVLMIAFGRTLKKRAPKISRS